MPSTRTPASDRASGPSPAEDRFAFRFDARYLLAGAAFGISPWTAWVRVTGSECIVRFGPWSVRTPRTNIASWERSGPYGYLRTMGPARLSLSDRGATFATNHDAGLCLRFERPQSILLPGGLIKSPGLTVTVAEVDRLDEALGRA
jgi:hypothetical protein